jgi:hypothetical protein
MPHAPQQHLLKAAPAMLCLIASALVVACSSSKTASSSGTALVTSTTIAEPSAVFRNGTVSITGMPQPNPSFAVAYQDGGGVPGPLLGASSLTPSNTPDASIGIDSGVPGWIVFHTDTNANNIFDPKIDRPITDPITNSVTPVRITQ